MITGNVPPFDKTGRRGQKRERKDNVILGNKGSKMAKNRQYRIGTYIR